MAVITIGAGTADRASSGQPGGQTHLGLANPADGSGLLTELAIRYISGSIENLRFGVFRLVSGTTYECISESGNLGNLSVPGINTFVVSMAVAIGDLLGFYCESNGLIDRQEDGGSGDLYVDGNVCVVGLETAFNVADVDRDYSYGGTGVTSAPPKRGGSVAVQLVQMGAI